MAHRARKYREIKKRVKVHMKEFLKEDSEGVKIAMESYLKDVTYQRNNTNDFYQLIDNNNENIDSNNYHLYENCVNDLKSDSDDTNDYCEDLNSNFDNESASFSNDNMSQSNSDISIKSEIQKWCIKENIKHSSINKLLKILKVHTNIENLPRNARTLLKTSRTTLVRKLGSSGDLHYIGITPNLQMKHKYYGDTIQLTFNVDGIPIYKSSSKQFWPILCYVIDKQYQYDPFLVSLFLGESKPEPITDYFEDFVPELKKLCENGFFHDRSQMEFKVVIRAFICDTPARCMIKCCKLFNAYSGCDRCEQEGVYINHRMTFPLQNAPLRTDESFASMSDPDHHKSISPLSELNIGLVSQIPLDYMHLVNLGCMRKLLIMLLKGDLRVRLSTNSIHCISNELIAQRMHFPIEFQRKPRSLKEIAYWKASEFRQFLLYSGIVVLNNNVPSAIYKHFLLLHVASTILCSTSLIVHYLNFASDLLRSFVNHWSKLYGADTVVYNVHCLTRLTADAKKYGILDSFSAFPFESFLFQLKRLLRTSNQPLQQIVKRLSESSHVLVAENKKLLHDYTKDKKFRYHVVLNSRHSDGPLTDFPCHVQQFRKIKMFSVMDFPDEESCEVIPTSWLTDGNHKTFYPQYKGTRFWKAVTTFETPKSCWKTHSCRVLYQTDLLTKAKSKRDGYQYLDTDEIQTGTEVIENQINKRKRFPNQRYASKSASEISSDEASLSSENDDKIDRNRNFISKNKFQCRKKSKPLPEPEPIKLPTSNDNIQNIDKEMSSHSSVLKTAARVATTSQPRANTSLSEGQITKFVITFEDIKYDIGSIKKDIKCIKNKLFSDNVTEEKLPEETETLVPALSLRNLSTFNELLKQKSVFALY